VSGATSSSAASCSQKALAAVLRPGEVLGARSSASCPASTSASLVAGEAALCGDALHGLVAALRLEPRSDAGVADAFDRGRARGVKALEAGLYVEPHTPAGAQRQRRAREALPTLPAQRHVRAVAQAARERDLGAAAAHGAQELASNQLHGW
jgi:hypothetical protein